MPVPATQTALTRSFSVSKCYQSTLSKTQRFAQPVESHTLPHGYLVASTYAGIKKAISPAPMASDAQGTGTSALTAAPPKPDLALVVSSVPAAVAGTFTTNRFKAAPVVHATSAMDAVGSDVRTRAVLTNSGCANAVTGEGGLQDVHALVTQVRSLLQPRVPRADATTSPTDVLMMSTGVIGVRLPVPAMQRAVQHLVTGQVLQSNADAWYEVARAFMTTDTFPKLRTRQFQLGDRLCRMAAIDKGAGMIHPHMTTRGGLHATLLGLVATDAPVAPATLQKCLDEAVRVSFNCISVDGDMSTNDTILALANGQAPRTGGGETIEGEITETSHPALVQQFANELKAMCLEMAHLIVRDGEGAEKFVEVRVRNAGSYEHAHAIAASVSTSALVKCAMHGADANWGRILCAAGYAKLPAAAASWEIDPSKVNVTFLPPPSASHLAPLPTLVDGVPQVVDEAHASQLLMEEDICIDIDLKGGSWDTGADAEAVYWTCDFSKDYITVSTDEVTPDQWRLPHVVSLLLVHRRQPRPTASGL